MKKRLFALFLALVMALGLTATAWAASVTADTSWYGDGKTNEYTISTKAELFGLAQLANDDNTFAGKTIKLANDIDLGGATWTPIKTFAGTLDGNSHTIKNFNMTPIVDADGDSYCGFIKTLAWGGAHSPDTGLVCNLTIQGVTAEISTNGRFATVACYAEGENENDYTDHQIYNVHVKNVKVTSTSADARVGGMFCRTSRSFKDCTVDTLTVVSPNGIVTLGGFVSSINGNNQRFQNCDVKNVTITAIDCSHSEGNGVGGFAGCMNNSTGSDSWTNFFENCDVSGLNMTVNGREAWAGGFIGSPCANIIASGCTVQGTIDASGATGGFVGGFMGNFGWEAANDGIKWLHELTGCTANVNITSGGAPAGGFIGSASTSNGGSKYGIFTNCTASGNVTNTKGTAGGFAGEATSGRYIGCTANGAVSGTTVGGFIGEVKDYTPTWGNIGYDKIGNANEVRLDGCAATGTVTGSANAGGLVGSVGAKTSLDADGSNGKLAIRNSRFNASNVNALGAMADSSKVRYTVSFDANGGTAVAPVTVTYGSKVTKPADPTKDGYTFVCWLDDDGAVYDFDTAVTSDLTLTAQWDTRHEPIRRQHVTAVEETTPDTDTKADETKTDVVTSAKTFDTGVAVYGAMAVASLLGMGYVGKKRV